jgi:hypothetical protein
VQGYRFSAGSALLGQQTGLLFSIRIGRYREHCNL